MDYKKLFPKAVVLLVCITAFAAGNCCAGMVSITFDDGLAGIYKHAFPVMKKYNQAATAAVIYNCLTTNNDDYMTVEELLDLQKNGWEISSHGLTHKSPTEIPKYYTDEKINNWIWDNRKKHIYQASYDYPLITCLTENGRNLKELDSLEAVARTPGSYYYDHVIEELHIRPFTPAAPAKLDIRSCSYQREMESSKAEMEKLGFLIRTYTTPYNIWSDDLKAVSKNYYDNVITGSESPNEIKNFDPHWIKRFVVYKHTTVNSLTRLVKKDVIEKDGWVVFCFHEIGDHVGWEPWSVERLDRFCAWLQEQQVKVVTISEGAALMKAAQAKALP
jgi:peptidoglycan/xylan/chitin deacetylase (PgdA/CDA1 family)